MDAPRLSLQASSLEQARSAASRIRGMTSNEVAEHESPGHRFRRPRTRPGLEARAIRRASTKCWSRPATPAPRPKPSAATSTSPRPTSTACSRWREREDVALTVVGPEAPLVAGVVDRFRAAACASSGRPPPPRSSKAARPSPRTSSRATASRPRTTRCITDVDAALAYVREKGAPIVIKADGLAAGKGVIVAMTLAEAEAAVTDMLAGNAFGAAGARVVIEEFLDGEEASFISMVDGKHRAADGDLAGPQARRRRRHRPEHRRHGRVLARAGGHAGSACARDARGGRTRPCAAWPPTACRSPASSTPA